MGVLIEYTEGKTYGSRVEYGGTNEVPEGPENREL